MRGIGRQRVIITQCVAVAATITGVGGYDGTQFLFGSVHHTRINPRNAACGNVDAVLSFDRLERDGLDAAVALRPSGEVVGVPAPHALPHSAVQLRGAAVIKTGAVRGIQLATLAVVRNQIAAKTQFGRQFL